MFQSAVGRVGATVSGDWGAVLGQVVDFLAGFLNGLTGGLLGHVIGLGEWLTGINLNGFVDTSSSAYTAGGRTAGVALLVLMVAAPGAMPALLAMQALGQGWSAAEAFQRGDYATGFLDLGNGILAGVGAGAAAEAGEAGRPGGGRGGGAGGGGDGGGGGAGGRGGGAGGRAGRGGGRGGRGAQSGRGGHAGAGRAAGGGGGDRGGAVPHRRGVQSRRRPWLFPDRDAGCGPLGRSRVLMFRDGDERRTDLGPTTAPVDWRPCRVIQTLTATVRKHSVLITAAAETVESTEAHAFWVLAWTEGLEAAAAWPGQASAPPWAATAGPLGGV